jgi:translation initiation factor IF-3
VKEVRVINPDGVQVGILPIQEALQAAQSLNLDLVEVAPEARPPVCRIMNYGKYRYEQSKRVREAKKKQTIIQIKEMKIRPKTEEHDFQFKARHVERFLREGNKAKIILMFRGREMVHQELGMRQLDKLAEALKGIAIIEQPARLEGRNMVMLLAPRPEGRGGRGESRRPPSTPGPSE